ncbi:MAG: type II secretion system F family protein [Fimbriimonadales bacterium]
MKSFSYVALDRAGLRTQGTLAAGSEPEARHALEGKGLFVEFVSEAATAAVASPKAAQPTSAPNDVTWAQVIAGKYEPEALNNLYRQIGSMVKAGVPLVSAITTISSGAYSPRIRSALEEIREAVHRGDPMSTVLERRKDVFPSLHVSVLKAAERGGFVDTAFAQLSEYLAQEIRVRNSWKRRTFYPKVLLVISLSIIIIANLVIASVAAKTGGPAMLLDSFLLNPVVYVPLLIAIFLVVMFLKAARGSYKAARMRDAIAFWIPHYASTAQMQSMAKFSRALAMLYGAGVPIREAVLLAGESAGNLLISESVRPLANKLGDGTSIWDALRQSDMFTAETLDMIRAGETTGSLQTLLEHIATHYEEEGNVRMEKFTTVLTVGILIAVLIVVASTIFGFWSNYFGQFSSFLE